MKRKRKHIPAKVLLAAALLQIDYLMSQLLKTERISYEDAKRMTADQIISCYEPDHYPIRHADGGPDEPWNITWRRKGEHREKTKRDLKEMAKTRRHEVAYFSAGDLPIAVIKKCAKRAWPKGRKLKSRPFPKRTKVK